MTALEPDVAAALAGPDGLDALLRVFLLGVGTGAGSLFATLSDGQAPAEVSNRYASSIVHSIQGDPIAMEAVVTEASNAARGIPRTAPFQMKVYGTDGGGS